MSTRLSKAAAQALADKLKASSTLQSQYNSLLRELNAAEAAFNAASTVFAAKRAALARFYGVSHSASVRELEMNAEAVHKAKKGR